jgi:basic amino acid/polyamine antiporter, APA family
VNGLQRTMTLGHAIGMVAGIMIGASIFVQPSEVMQQVPSETGVVLVWAAAGVLTFFGALACAELSSAFPGAGGVYLFLKEAYSPGLGFLWGWAMFWIMHSGIIAAIMVIFARYVGYFVPLGETGIRAVAIGGIVALSVVNYCGVKQGSTLQAYVTFGKIAAIGVLLVALLVFGHSAAHVAAGTEVAPTISLRHYLLAISAGLFAFGGWHMVSYTSEETRNPQRTIPVALMSGTLIVTVCYIALNAAYYHALPMQQVMHSTRIAADAAEAAVGARAGRLISALVIFSAFGAANGIVLTGPRVYFAMARDGLLFRWAAAVHPRFHTPHRAIALQAVWASALVATGSYRTLFTRVIYTEWLFFGLMALGVFILRRRPGYSPAYRAWGYPVVPAIFVLAAFAIVGNQISSDPLRSLTGLGFVALGWPVYYLWSRSKRGQALSSHRQGAALGRQ